MLPQKRRKRRCSLCGWQGPRGYSSRERPSSRNHVWMKPSQWRHWIHPHRSLCKLVTVAWDRGSHITFWDTTSCDGNDSKNIVGVDVKHIDDSWQRLLIYDDGIDRERTVLVFDSCVERWCEFGLGWDWGCGLTLCDFSLWRKLQLLRGLWIFSSVSESKIRRAHLPSLTPQLSHRR